MSMWPWTYGFESASELVSWLLNIVWEFIVYVYTEILKYLKILAKNLELDFFTLSMLSPMLMHKMAAEYRHAHVEIDQHSLVS